MVDQLQLWVGGRWQPGGGALRTLTDPADGSVVARLREADADDVKRAVAAASAAQPQWGETLPHRRARVLITVAERIEREAERLALLQTRNTGKPLSESRALLASASATFRYFAAVAESHDDELTARRGPWVTTSELRPIGVVAAITPWNSPAASEAQKLAPALAAGNGVVVKPAEWTPLIALEFGRLLEDLIPPGLVSVLAGDGSVGEALVRHPDVGLVSFTGGTATGRHIAAAAAAKLMPVSLELGGKSPTVIFPDADLDRALDGIGYGIFSSAGQSCVAGSRLFVPEPMTDEVVAGLIDRACGLRLGPGTDPATDVGPLVHADHRSRVASMVDEARSEGGVVVTGGEIPTESRLRDGTYYRPTIITGLANDSATARREIFGPVLTVLPYRDEDDLVDQANDNPFGLACGLWTRDYRTAHRVAGRIRAGTVWINTYKRFSISTPFGGLADSGLGAEKGRQTLAVYSQRRSTFWDLDDGEFGFGAGRR